MQIHGHQIPYTNTWPSSTSTPIPTTPNWTIELQSKMLKYHQVRVSLLYNKNKAAKKNTNFQRKIPKLQSIGISIWYQLVAGLPWAVNSTCCGQNSAFDPAISSSKLTVSNGKSHLFPISEIHRLIHGGFFHCDLFVYWRVRGFWNGSWLDPPINSTTKGWGGRPYKTSVEQLVGCFGSFRKTAKDSKELHSLKRTVCTCQVALSQKEDGSSSNNPFSGASC